MLDAAFLDAVSSELKQRSCFCEYGEFGATKDLKMLAVSVPAGCDYDGVFKYLSECEAIEKLSFSELAI